MPPDYPSLSDPDWRVRAVAAMRAEQAQSGIDQGLRAGVTFTQHAVLDLLAQRAALWSDIATDAQIEQARINAFDARNMHSAVYKHGRLVEAAARLLDAAERLAREARDG